MILAPLVDERVVDRRHPGHGGPGRASRSARVLSPDLRVPGGRQPADHRQRRRVGQVGDGDPDHAAHAAPRRPSPRHHLAFRGDQEHLRSQRPDPGAVRTERVHPGHDRDGQRHRIGVPGAAGDQGLPQRDQVAVVRRGHHLLESVLGDVERLVRQVRAHADAALLAGGVEPAGHQGPDHHDGQERYREGEPVAQTVRSGGHRILPHRSADRFQLFRR